MPYLHVHTNVSVREQASFLSQCSGTVALALGKPESFVMVELSQAQPMMFDGSEAPLAFLELKSLGLEESQTLALSKTLCELIEQELGVEQERIYIEFAAPERTMFGYNGGTF